MEAPQDPRRIFTGYSIFVTSVEYSPDGMTLATTDGMGIKLLKLPRESEWGNLPGNYVAFSSDSSTLLASSQHGTAHIWNIATGARVRQIELPIQRSFSADFTKAACIAADETVDIWDFEKHEKRTLPAGHLRPVERLLLSPDGRTLALAGGERVQFIDLSPATPLGEIPDIYRTPADDVMAFSPKSDRFVTACEEDLVEVFSAKLWDLTGKQATTFSGHDYPIRAVAFSGDGRMLATASWTNIKLY